MNTLTKSKHYKAVCGAVFAFLVCAGSFVPTPVYADSSSTLSALDTWILDIESKTDNLLQAYVDASGNPTLQTSYYASVVACTAWESYAKYCYHAVDTFDPSYTTIPTSNLWFGWYYLPDDTNFTDPRSCTIFGYGVNGDKLKIYGHITIPVASARDFTVSLTCQNSPSGDNIPTLQVWNLINDNTAISYYVSYSDTSGTTVQNAKWASVNGTPYFNVNVTSPSGGYKFKPPGSMGVKPSGNLAGYAFSVLSSSNAMSYFCGQLYGESTPYNNLLVYPGSSSDLSDINDVIHDAILDINPDFPPELWEDIPSNSNRDGFDSLEFPPYIPSVDFHDVELPSETSKAT